MAKSGFLLFGATILLAITFQGELKSNNRRCEVYGCIHIIFRGSSSSKFYMHAAHMLRSVQRNQRKTFTCCHSSVMIKITQRLKK